MIIKMPRDFIQQSQSSEPFTSQQLIQMLALAPDSAKAYQIMAEANRISQELTKNKAEIHAQLALNLAPCPCNCKFCSFAAVNGIFSKSKKINPKMAVSYARQFEQKGANAIYVMTTANYDFGEFMEISREIRRNLKQETILVANIGDVNLARAKKVKSAGYQGVYHAVRLREGVDTGLNPSDRLNSIRVFQEAGLLVGTCVEPIGPEHSNAEIADMILLTNSFSPVFSGAARRIPVPGSALEKYGMISELRMAQIVAVTRLGLSRKIKGNCTHEPCTLGVMGGANLLWAEAGANPRDIEEKTEKNRGCSIENCRSIYEETNWGLLKGPSVYFSKTIS